jgi:hypothetical protein
MDTFWLNFVNIALGLVTLMCLLAVLGGVGHELIDWLRRRAAVQDGHAFSTPELGLTMTDGGERLDGNEDVERRQTRT